VVEKVSYPPVPSPASLTPPQLFSPGQIHMHMEGETDGGMERGGGIEGERERDS